jgi:hypothetical protein
MEGTTMDDAQAWVGDWIVHRYTLEDGVGRHTVLRDDVTDLTITPARRSFAAEFDLYRGPARLLLSRQPFGNAWSSYYGAGSVRDEPHHSRIVLLHDLHGSLQALIGHVSLQDDHETRDFFVATRDKRRIAPVIKESHELKTICIPLQDSDLPSQPEHPVSLHNETTHHVIKIDRHPYRIMLQPHGTGGLHFSAIEDPLHRIGGLVLPLDRDEQHMLVVCFRHLHQHGSHPTEPAGDVPGHPMCTAVFGAYGGY